MGNKLSCKCTHVANAYTEVIYVKCDAERSYLELEKFKVDVASKTGASAGVEVEKRWEWNKIKAHGFSRVHPLDYLGFDVDLRDRNTVYISIIAEDGTQIANCLPKVGDRSIIVTATGQVKNTKYGSIWVDNGGRNHMRKKIKC